MNIVAITLLIMFLLFTKHFVIDFPLQGPFQYRNKGTYGHPGGLLHSGLHGVFTFIIFAFFAPGWLIAFSLGLMDFLLHYHIDWAKMNLNKRLGWGPTTHEQFWWLLGVDQFLHAITYIGLTAIFLKDFL